MKNKKLLILAVAAATLVICLTIFAVAVTTNSDIQNFLGYIVGKESTLNEFDADVNADGKVNIIDLILYAKGQRSDRPYLDTLTLDGGYTIDFKKDTLEYHVALPSGRPRIPKVTASASGNLNVEVVQAVISDNSDTSYAEVTVSRGVISTVYKIHMTKDIANGFRLQYDDRYMFVPNGQAGQTYTFESSNTSVATVDSDGKITAKAVSSSPVTITAKANGTVVDTLTIDEIEKAQVALFFVTGQSNAQGCYDYTTEYPGPEGNNVKSIQAEIERAEQPSDLGMVYCYDYYLKYGSPTYTSSPKQKLFDMKSYKHSGFASALGTNWYNLTGEKVCIIQVAYDGAPIEAWLDADRHSEAGNHGYRNYYSDTKKAYNTVMQTLENGNYDINRRYRYWLQGETCMNSIYVPDNGGGWNHSPASNEPRMTDEEYYTYFTYIKNDMKEDFGIDFTGILLVRATTSVASSESRQLGLLTDIVPIRAAQYTLANRNDDISLVSRICDIALMDTKGSASDEGHGYVGPRNLHYNQIGHNANGKAAAETTYHKLTINREEKTGIEIIDTNGRNRLTANDTLRVEKGSTYRVAATAVPISSNTSITYSSSDEAIATVNQYGLITAKQTGDAVITATAPDGTSQSVKVNVFSNTVEPQKIDYEWNFNDLTEKSGKNDLTLSELSQTNGNTSYTITDGIYTGTKSGGAGPEFSMDKSFTVSNEYSWSIEWRTKLSGGSLLFGKRSSSSGIIYLAYATNFNSDKNNLTGPAYHPFRIVDNNGKQIMISFGDYASRNTAWNTWKAEYNKDTGILSLNILNGDTWETVGTTSPGTFSVTFTNMFGRFNDAGLVNLFGSVDYIKVSTYQKIN